MTEEKEPLMKSTTTMNGRPVSDGITGDLSAEQPGLSQRSEESWYNTIDDLPLEWPKSPLDTVILLAKVLGFLPWCIAVGGAIMLYPTQLELVAFNTGYQSSLKGIQRFAYYADCAMQHVAIFVGCVAVLCWWSSTFVTTLLVATITAGFCLAWGDFVLDRSIPLGHDDRQTIYLVFTNYGLQGDSIVFRKTEAGYFALEESLVDNAGVEGLVE
jgi:hypothetical protein